MRPTFKQTVDKLIHWYLNDELQHGDCAHCVVGNLCGGHRTWRHLFMTDSDVGIQLPLHPIQFVFEMEGVKDKDELIRKAHDLCRTTGYTVGELMQIEFAFEMAPRGSSEDDYMFNGLCAVVDVLAEIHNIDLSVREEAKLLFVKV